MLVNAVLAHRFHQVASSIYVAAPQLLGIFGAVRQHGRAMRHAVDLGARKHFVQRRPIPQIDLMFLKIRMLIVIGNNVHADTAIPGFQNRAL